MSKKVLLISLISILIIGLIYFFISNTNNLKNINQKNDSLKVPVEVSSDGMFSPQRIK